MKSKEKIFDEIQSLLTSQFFCVLATQGKEYPYCTLVGYAVSHDGKEIVFATVKNTQKYKNLKQKPNISLLIDTQTNQVEDIKDAQALTVLGTAGELNFDEHEKYLALYLKKHPHLKEFVTAPDCALIRVKVSKYILVSNFQNVHEYAFG